MLHSSDVGVGGGGYFVHCYIVLLVLVVAEGNLKPELREIICARRPPALTVGDLLKFYFKTIFFLLCAIFKKSTTIYLLQVPDKRFGGTTEMVCI